MHVHIWLHVVCGPSSGSIYALGPPYQDLGSRCGQPLWTGLPGVANLLGFRCETPKIGFPILADFWRLDTPMFGLPWCGSPLFLTPRCGPLLKLDSLVCLIPVSQWPQPGKSLSKHRGQQSTGLHLENEASLPSLGEKFMLTVYHPCFKSFSFRKGSILRAGAARTRVARWIRSHFKSFRGRLFTWFFRSLFYQQSSPFLPWHTHIFRFTDALINSEIFQFVSVQYYAQNT